MKRHGSSVSSCAGRALCAVLTTACLCGAISAFIFSTATITGRVTDSNAAVIAGAKVDANNIDTNVTFSTVTNDEGLFVLPNLPPGRYRIFVQKDGFQTIVKPNVVLHVQDIISLSFTMQLGSITQSVTVEGGAPLIQKESAAVGTVVDRQFVANLPLNGRSFQSLIALTPGVVLTRTDPQNAGQFSVNGQRANANYFIVDGVSANIGVSNQAGFGQAEGGGAPGLTVFGGTNNLVSVDALQEFKIQTSTYAPEFGRTPGAQVSIVTRSGTNNFHGNAFDYFRNDALDATDWFANSRRLKKPPLRQNDFGGVIGGPIIKNRTFFFFSYEGLRLRLPSTLILSVPSVNARLIAPPAIKPFLNAFPVPNGRDLGNNVFEFNAAVSNPTTLDATSIRVDHTVSSKLNLFARYNDAPSEAVSRRVTLDTSKSHTQTLTSGAIWSITPAVSNDFRANYSRHEAALFARIDDFGGAVIPPDSALFPSPFSSQDSRYNFFASPVSFLVGKTADNFQRQINLVDTLSIISGAHQLKLGIDYRKLSPIFDPAKYLLGPNFGNINGALTGRASVVSIIHIPNPTFPVFTNLSVFGQDTWRVSPRLTLTFGLRWELNPPPSEKNGRDPFALTGIDNPATLTLVAPQGTPLYQTIYGNIAPRIGVAYQLLQKKGRETTLRGGFGVFYDSGFGAIANAFANSFPNRLTKVLRNVQFPLDPAAAAPPTLSLTPDSVIAGVDPKLKLPYTLQWNFAVEQSLGSDQTVSASYVAAVGRRLLRNGLLFNASGSPVALATRNEDTSDYHALQLQFQRRLARGLQALASHTWSHSIDSASGDSSQNLAGSAVDPKVDRGPSDFDIRHTFTAAVTYDLPKPNFGTIGNAALHHWSIDSIVMARSAAPVNVLTGSTLFLLPVTRPDLVAGAPLYVNDPAVAGGRRINRLAFTTPVGRQGSLGRNALRGLPAWQVNFGLRRQFNLTEQLNLQVKAELFNAFNHPNFANPVENASLTSGAAFGTSTLMLASSLGGLSPLYQIGGPRSMQLSLKIGF